MTPIFAYITHTNGVLEDSAAELFFAAKKLDAAVSPIAIVTGWGQGLDSACDSLRTLYREVWKISNEALSYPDAELVRKALIKVLPAGSTLLVAHNHFGIDLSPGLTVKTNAAFLSDVVNIEDREGPWLKVVRQEFGGQVSTHVRCDISSGAVVNIRPGAFKSQEMVPVDGIVVDKSGEIGTLTAGRRYLQTIVAESGDVDISKQPVLVSIGRGIQEAENVKIAEALAEVMGAVVSCSRPVVDAKWMDKSRQVGSSGKTVNLPTPRRT
jgi:electron transfer flavoprotein alpha subunit